MSAPDSPSEQPLSRLRRAYAELNEPEKGCIIRFAARRRFTDDTFETWVKLSGLPTGEVRREAIAERQLPLIRERLDATILDAANGELLKSLVGSFLRDGEPERVEALVEWARSAAPATMPGNLAHAVKLALDRTSLPAEFASQPGFGLVRAALLEGLFDEWLACLDAEGNEDRAAEAEAQGCTPARETPLPAGNPGLRKAWENWLRDLDALAAAIDGLRGLPEPGSGSDLIETLRESLGKVTRLRAACRDAGILEWRDAADLAEQIRSLREAHSCWADSLSQWLAARPTEHPLRRKREAFEEQRKLAKEELRVLSGAGEIDGEVPGPMERPEDWWTWATGLDEAGFETLENWCGRNGLECLADLVAEEWTGTGHAKPTGKNGGGVSLVPDRLPANGHSAERITTDGAAPAETAGAGMGLAGLAARRLNGPEPSQGPRAEGANGGLAVRSLRLAMENIEANRRPVTGTVGPMPIRVRGAGGFGAAMPPRLG